jgi:DNA-binding IclR family transcriptional regulator
MTVNSAQQHCYFVTRTVQAIEHLADAPRSAEQLAELLTIHPRTVRRLLNRLVADGYAQRQPGPRGRYELTAQLPAKLAHLAADNSSPASHLDATTPRRTPRDDESLQP